MDWLTLPPESGDIVRTRVTFYYHYGIFVNGGRIIQFGLPDNIYRKADEIEVIAADVYTFLQGGGELEVLSRRQKIKGFKRLSAEQTVQNAELSIGQRGYDVRDNNCEHFAFGCAFKSKKSKA